MDSPDFAQSSPLLSAPAPAPPTRTHARSFSPNHPRLAASAKPSLDPPPLPFFPPSFGSTTSPLLLLPTLVRFDNVAPSPPPLPPLPFPHPRPAAVSLWPPPPPRSVWLDRLIPSPADAIAEIGRGAGVGGLLAAAIEHLEREPAANDAPLAALSPWELQLVLVYFAQEYRTTESEFADPIAFISRVEREAAAYGICKVIPPYPRHSRRFVFTHLNRSLVTSSDGPNPLSSLLLSRFPNRASSGDAKKRKRTRIRGFSPRISPPALQSAITVKP